MNISAINSNFLSPKRNLQKNDFMSVNDLSKNYEMGYASSLNQIAKVNSLAVNKSNRLVHLSFTGNADKNPKQFMFFSAEDKADGLKMYKMGGEAVVVQEAGNNWAEQYADKGIDVRKFKAYHSYNNPGGGLKVLTTEKEENGNPKIKDVSQNYELEKGENFIILDSPNNGKPSYKIIEDANIKGVVKRIDEKLEIKDVPYRLFKATDPKHKNLITYYIHSKSLAALPAAYGVGAGTEGAYGSSGCEDYKYATGALRELIDILPKMNNEEHGFYKPGNIWLHDRQAFPFTVFASEESSKGNEYFNGLKMHNTFHNPGASYQGHYDNAIEFFRIVGSEDDLNKLKENKDDYDFAKQIYDEINTKQQLNLDNYNANHKTDPALKKYLSIDQMLTKEQKNTINKIFEPVIGSFKDERGEYNICEIPIQGVRKNSFNTSAGTVSSNYGKEMKDCNTPEIAEGLTNDLNSIPTHDIVNGSTPANMKTNEIGSFGLPGNGFNTDEIKNGYTPFEVKISEDGKKVLNLDEVVEAKAKNTKWLINTIADATKKGKDALDKLFFNNDQLHPIKKSDPKAPKIPPAEVLGGFSEYKEGDKVFIGWGRPDPQKGFPTTFEAFLSYIKNPNIPKEEKLHAKLLVGAGGPNPWDPDSPDWQKIKDLIVKIAEVDGGAYKNNACYVNGFFANRFANASSIGDLTSVYEPCGITPLESYAAGNPVLSIRTGGAPDFVKNIETEKLMKFLENKDKEGLINYINSGNKTGFLTKHAFLVKPEIIGKAKDLTGDALNDARREALGSEVSDCMHLFMMMSQDKDVEKALMENSMLQKTDWHNNNAYNGGKSANERYFEEVFGLDKNLNESKPRNIDKLTNLKGKFEKVIQGVKTKAQDVATKTEDVFGEDAEKPSFFKSKTGKITIGVVALAAVGGGIYAAILNKNKSKAKQEDDKNLSTVA